MNKVPDCQDWTPVVFKKKSNIMTKPALRPGTGSSLENVGVYALKRPSTLRNQLRTQSGPRDAKKSSRRRNWRKNAIWMHPLFRK